MCTQNFRPLRPFLLGKFTSDGITDGQKHRGSYRGGAHLKRHSLAYFEEQNRLHIGKSKISDNIFCFKPKVEFHSFIRKFTFILKQLEVGIRKSGSSVKG